MNKAIDSKPSVALSMFAGAAAGASETLITVSEHPYAADPTAAFAKAVRQQ